MSDKDQNPKPNRSTPTSYPDKGSNNLPTYRNPPPPPKKD